MKTLYHSPLTALGSPRSKTLQLRARHAARCAAIRRGFTLIEVLVVLMILGISIGLITVNLSRDGGTQLEDKARRLALLLQFARDEAIVSGQPLAFTARRGGYIFSRKERGRGWMQVSANDALAPRASAANTIVSRLRIAGVTAMTSESLVFSSSGMNLPYELELAAGAWRVTLFSDAAGRVSVTRAVKEEVASR